MKGKSKQFSLPPKYNLLISEGLYLVFLIVIAVFPLTIVLLLNTLSYLSDMNFRILLGTSMSYFALMGLLLHPSWGLRREYLDRLQNYPIKNWLLKSFRCIECGGNLKKAIPKGTKVIFFYQYYYQCGNCNIKFTVEPDKNKRNSWIFKKKL